MEKRNGIALMPSINDADEGLVHSTEAIAAAEHSGFTVAPIVEAITTNDVKLVHELLAQGADPNTRDSAGNTLLHIAAELGLSMLAKMLVWAGGDLEARAGIMDATPLIIAAANGMTSTAIVLLELGADPRAEGAQGTTTIEVAARNDDVRLLLALIKRGAVVDSRSVNGWTPLHAAAGFNTPRAIAVLLKFGANPNNQDTDGDTPLMTACSMGHTECVQQLLDGGADPRILTPVSTHNDISMYCLT